MKDEKPRNIPERVIFAERGAETHMADRPLVRSKTTIYVRRGGGSGNQLFQFAFGKALAVELDADLYFDTDVSHIAHEQFVMKFPNISQQKTPPFGTAVHHSQPKGTPEEFEDMKRRIADGPDHAIIWGNFQTHHHIVRHEAAIRAALSIEPLPEYQGCIAVCVRRGDCILTGCYIDLSPQWFAAAVEYVKSRISRPGKVVVFTDDTAWCRANLPWEVASQDAWHDIRAIRSCAGVVFTNSTFHWWGAWLANVPTVCAAAINYQYSETFYDPRWVQMHNDGVVSIPVEPGGHITSAIYGADRGRFDVTNLINKLHARGLRHIRASNEIAGDPVPNVVKRLELEFADGRSLNVPENEIADLGDLCKIAALKGDERITIDLRGKLAVVTGAAGELGRVITRTLARCGADVAIHYNTSENQAKALLQEVQSTGRKGMIVQADVGDAAAVNQMRQTICAQLGEPDIVVANAVAQIHPWQTVLEESIQDYEAQFRTCVLQNVLLAKAFVPAMIRKKWGRVIAISTECVMQCTPTQSAYVAGKRGMDGMLRVLAREVGPHQITVNQVAPGWTISERDRRAGSQSQPQYEQNVPLRRRGTDNDVANAVAFLASDLASFITGVYLPVCGGNVMG
jgi:3-oxoacyl-[acyl-carrier protein] reductase